MRIYFISGLGANFKAFKSLEIPSDFEAVPIEWKIPEVNETLEHYVERLAENIDIHSPFHIAGLSFGGIVAQELQEYVSPEKTILISTIRNRQQMPAYMKFSSRYNAHKAVPMSFFTSDKVLSYTFFRNMYNPKMPKLDEFFTHKDPYYLSWAIDKIVNWKPKRVHNNNIYQMHGTKDVIFPFKNFSDEVDAVQNGTHIMVLQKPKQVSKLLTKYITT